MSTQPQTEVPIDEIAVTDKVNWEDGPPYEIFKRLRGECPVHFSEMNDWEGEAGIWSVTKADDVHTVSRDWETYSSELGGITGMSVIPLEMLRGMFIAQDPPKHDRVKALFQRGFTPKRIAEHEDAIREITQRVLDGVGRPRRVRPRQRRRAAGRLARDRELHGHPREGRRDVGQPHERDARVRRPGRSTRAGARTSWSATSRPSSRAAASLIAERTENPTDDLTSVLVHAEIDGERLTETEIVMGFFLLVAAGNDSTKATYTSGMRALLENPDQMQLLLDDPSLIPGAVEECLRMFPAFAHFRRTATVDTELGGCPIKAGDKVVMWYVSSNRDEDVYEDPDRFDVLRNPEHQAFGAGGRHFCLGTALARLELRILFEETLKRLPTMELAGDA